MTGVTDDPEEAARLVAEGSPVVLVGQDAEALGRLVASLGGGGAGGEAVGGEAVGGEAGGGEAVGRRQCLLGVLVGDLSDPAVANAAVEMARELWPWAGD